MALFQNNTSISQQTKIPVWSYRKELDQIELESNEEN